MKGFVIDTEKGISGEVDFEDKLDNLYGLLNCDCIDIAVRYVDGKEFDVICDDEGLLKDNPIPSAVDKNLNVMFCGSILFAHHDDEGNFTGLSEDDVKLLNSKVKHFVTGFGIIKVVCEVEYE